MKRKRFLRLAMMALGVLLLLITMVACAAQQSPTTAPQGSQPASSPQPTVQQPTTSIQPTPVVVQAPAGIKANPAGIEYLDPVPMSKMVHAIKAPVRTTPAGATKVPLITWGADEATILANGARTTQPSSIFAREGLNIELFREDNFVRAVEKVIAGETPYLRGTKDMISAALEVLKEQGIKMVEIYNLSRSTGGDTMVCRSDMVRTAADLKGRYVGLQLYGPHMYYLARLLKDGGLSINDVKIRWLRELTIPPYDTKGVAVDPMSAMQRDPTLACVMVISPDMMALTSGGNVGTGAESSVKGAYMLLSTKEAGNVIYDVYVVRKDYLDVHRAEVQKFVHGLMVATEEQIDLFNQKDQRQEEYRSFVRLSAVFLRDNEQLVADVEGLYADMTFAKYAGNVQFYSGQGTTRTFDVLTKETQEALIGYGLLLGYVPLDYARWDYAVLAQGLRDTAGVSVPKFDPVKVQQYVSSPDVAAKSGFVEFIVYFGASEVNFSVDEYKLKFDTVIEMAQVYAGAVIVIEGQVDPGFYNALKQKGSSEQELKQTRSGAINTSKKRADSVQKALMEHAAARGVTINPTQFTTTGVGFDKATHPDTITPIKLDASGSYVFDRNHDTPEMQRKRQENRKVVFKFIPAVAEIEER